LVENLPTPCYFETFVLAHFQNSENIPEIMLWYTTLLTSLPKEHGWILINLAEMSSDASVASKPEITEMTVLQRPLQVEMLIQLKQWIKLGKQM